MILSAPGGFNRVDTTLPVVSDEQAKHGGLTRC